jgi:hypothetical protein
MSERIRVKQISETEYIVGHNKTQLVDENIIQVMAEGPQNDETALVQAAINRMMTPMLTCCCVIFLTGRPERSSMPAQVMKR